MLNPELVTATNLEQASALLEGQGLLPRLVRRLLTQTPGVQGVTIRTAEGVRLEGWDGKVEVSPGGPYLPAGTSRWEIGTGQDPRAKANEDYEKRSGNPLGADPAQAAFVFVTGRRWSGKEDWLGEHTGDGVWRELKVLDADDLHGWLELAPAVHIWISEELGHQPLNVETLERWWQRWSTQTDPGLPLALLIAGRGQAADELREALGESPSVHGVQSESRDEALGFIAAALLPAVDDIFARVTPGGTDSRLTDAVGSTVALTGALGWPADTTYEYGPFGETTQTGAPNDNPYQFTGRENDGDGLYHHRARYYRPDQQRFLSEDPLGLASGDTNLYTYAANDPLNMIDPLGLSPFGAVFGPGGFVDRYTPDAWSEFSAGLFDGFLVGLPSAAFASAGCWGSSYDDGQFFGAVGGGAMSGLSITLRIGARGIWGLAGAGAVGGAFGGAHTTAGLNPGASADQLATGGILGAAGGAAGGGLAGAARGGGAGAAGAAGAGGAATGEGLGTGFAGANGGGSGGSAGGGGGGAGGGGIGRGSRGC